MMYKNRKRGGFAQVCGNRPAFLSIITKINKKTLVKYISI